MNSPSGHQVLKRVFKALSFFLKPESSFSQSHVQKHPLFYIWNKWCLPNFRVELCLWEDEFPCRLPAPLWSVSSKSWDTLFISPMAVSKQSPSPQLHGGSQAPKRLRLQHSVVTEPKYYHWPAYAGAWNTPVGWQGSRRKMSWHHCVLWDAGL